MHTKIALLLMLCLGACAVEELPEDLPQAGAVAQEPDPDTCSEETAVGSESDGVGVIAQAATACLGRPANRKLLSPSCPTCPVIWVYVPVGEVQSYTCSDATAAAKVWNDKFGWRVVGVDCSQPTVDTVPTYGVVLRRHPRFALASPTAGGQWGPHFLGCYRDEIRIKSDTTLAPWYVQHIMAHEIGHALIRDYFSTRHSSDPDSILYPKSLYNNIDDKYVLRLNSHRQTVLNGNLSQPCDLRGLEC